MLVALLLGSYPAPMVRTVALLVPTCLRPVAQRACAPRWQRLVSPERRLYIVTNEVELQSAVPEAPAGKARTARTALISNLRQMLEWTSVGNSSGDINDRSERKKAGNWQPLGGVHWLKHDDGPEIVPLVGSSGHKYKTVVEPHPSMQFNKRKMENLLNTSTSHADGWRLVSAPGQVYALGNGESLVDCWSRVDPSAAQVLHPPFMHASVSVLSLCAQQSSHPPSDLCTHPASALAGDGWHGGGQCGGGR